MEASGKYDKINGIEIIHGRIVDNPFTVRYVRTQASQWMLQKEDLLKNYIRKRMGSLKVGETVEDCFAYGIDYFLQENKVFNGNYFGNDTDYTVGRYVISSIPAIITLYRRSLHANKEMLSLVTFGEHDTYGRNYKISEREVHADIDIEKSVGEQIRYPELFAETVQLFKRFKFEKNYLPFSEADFLFYQFIDIRFTSVEEQREYVAKNLGIPLELVKLVVEDMVSEKKSDEVMGIYQNVVELLRAYKEGSFQYEVIKDV